MFSYLFQFRGGESDDVLRIYLTFCDKYNRGRLGYIDVNPDNPSEIYDYSRQPVLDIGNAGCFDDSGVVATSILKYKDLLYLYYCGYQKQVNVPYSSLMGIAVSNDNGNSFRRIKNTPVLERKDGEMFIRTGAGVYKYGNTFRLYYAAGNEWFDQNGHLVPKYSFKYIDSSSPIKFDNNAHTLFPLLNDEFGMTTPQINMTTDGLYEMVYSIRADSYGYRMGYAISKDGLDFKRKDSVMNIDRPSNDFDSEMICYGKIYRYRDRVYLFYSGNHYGIGGLGWAELM